MNKLADIIINRLKAAQRELDEEFYSKVEELAENNPDVVLEIEETRAIRSKLEELMFKLKELEEQQKVALDNEHYEHLPYLAREIVKAQEAIKNFKTEEDE